MRIKRLTCVATLAIAVCVAQEPKKETKQELPKAKPAAVTGQPGMVIVRTPDGGLRAPTAEEHQALTGQRGANLASTTAAPQQVVLGGGKGVMVRLDASTQVFSVAKIGPDGKLVMEEAVGQKAAEGLLQTGAKPKGTEKKEAEQ